MTFKKKAVSYYWRLILLELTRISNDNWNWSEFLSSGIFHRLRKVHATKFMHNFLQCEILSLLIPGQNPALTSFAKRYLIKTNVLILLCKDNFIERQVALIVSGKKKIRKNRKNTDLQYGLLWRISSFDVKIFLMLQLKWEILLPIYDIKAHHVTHFCLTWKQGKNEEKYLTFGFNRQKWVTDCSI